MRLMVIGVWNSYALGQQMTSGLTVKNLVAGYSVFPHSFIRLEDSDMKVAKAKMDFGKRNDAPNITYHRVLPIAVATLIILIGNYTVLRPSASNADASQEVTEVSIPTTEVNPTVKYPVDRGSVLEFDFDGTWKPGTVTSLQHDNFSAILANGTIVEGISKADFKNSWRLPCMGNKPGDVSLARTSLPDGPKTSPVPKLSDHFLDRFIVIPEYKLLFCYVEKVGCSMFNLVFRYLRLMHPDMTREEAEHILGVPEGKIETSRNWFKNTPEHHHISKAQLEKMLASEEWTKAFFYRDPVSRFVSAFRSKCDAFDQDGAWHCREAFMQKSIAFEEALYQMTQPGINHLSANPHFASFGSFCGGLDKTLDYYDIVQPLNPKTVGSFLETMFDKVGVDKATTKTLIEEVVNSRGRLSSDIARVQERWGLEPDYGVDEKHNTNSGDVFSKYMSSPETFNIVEDFYAADYALFRSPKTSEKQFCPAESG